MKSTEIKITRRKKIKSSFDFNCYGTHGNMSGYKRLRAIWEVSVNGTPIGLTCQDTGGLVIPIEFIDESKTSCPNIKKVTYRMPGPGRGGWARLKKGILDRIEDGIIINF